MTNGENGKLYSHDDLYTALRDVEDLMDRLLTPYVLLDKTAESVKQNKLLEGDGIDVGIKKTALTQYVYDILKTFLNYKKEDIEHGFFYNARNNVPIRVKVYTKDYDFFKYADRKVYQYGLYDLPNPFDEYWKAKDTIE